jgi:hypothetical protein
MSMTKETERAMTMSRSIQPMLAGLGPDIQGAVLADLVSLYFAGHNPEIREKSIDLWIETMRELIPESEKEIAKWWGDIPGAWWDEEAKS